MEIPVVSKSNTALTVFSLLVAFLFISAFYTVSMPDSRLRFAMFGTRFERKLKETFFNVSDVDLTIANFLMPNQTVEFGETIGTPTEIVTMVGYEVKLLVKQAEICSNDTGRVIFVTSRSESYSRRMEIRESWASFFDTILNIKTVFIVGLECKSKENSTENLLEEAKNFKDLVVYDFCESYRNLTLKTGLSFYWVAEYCRSASFVIKADDDTVVLPGGVKEVLKKYDQTKNEIFGNIFAKPWPIRDKNSKW